MAYTAEELEGLTDAEREAINFDDTNVTDSDVDAAPAAPPAVAVADPKPADAKPDPAAADPAAAAAPVAEPAAAAAPAAEPAAAPAPAPAVAPEPAQASFLVIAPPADAKEKLEKIAADKTALAEQFDAGEVTAAQYQAKLDELNDAKLDITQAVNNAKLTAQLEENRAKQVWGAQCDAFMATDAGKEYAADKALLDQFDEAVIALAKMPSNRNLSGDALLVKAHKFVQMERGIVTPPAAAAPGAKQLPKPRDPLPPTLQNVPSADVTDTSGGQYAHLDRLASSDPIAYERELAKMSDTARDAYMRAG